MTTIILHKIITDTLFRQQKMSVSARACPGMVITHPVQRVKFEANWACADVEVAVRTSAEVVAVGAELVVAVVCVVTVSLYLHTVSGDVHFRLKRRVFVDALWKPWLVVDAFRFRAGPCDHPVGPLEEFLPLAVASAEHLCSVHLAIHDAELGRREGLTHVLCPVQSAAD